MSTAPEHHLPSHEHDDPPHAEMDEESMQGRKIRLRDLSVEEQRRAIEDAFGYRGDVSLVLDDDTIVTGFLFDRQWDPNPPSEDERSRARGRVRLIVRDTGQRETLAIEHLIGIAFTGRDTALGKSWKTWLRKIREAQERCHSDSNDVSQPEEFKHNPQPKGRHR